MSAHSRVPQLVPWLANKAGIGEDRANALWRESEQWAEQQASRDSSDYHELAVKRVRELVLAESLREDLASLGWRPWVRAQALFWTVSMQAAQQTSAAMARSWRQFGSGVRHYGLG